MAGKYRDLSGETLGYLRVLGPIENTKRGTHYKCLCDCGKETEASVSQLIFGKKASCGCRMRKRKPRDPDRRAVLLRKIFRSKLVNSGEEFCLELRDLDLFEFIITSPCFYCGNPPDIIAKDKNKKGELVSNLEIPHHGIDRLDSSVGYTLANIVPCCKICNAGKEILSPIEFVSHVKNICRHQGLQNHLWEGINFDLAKPIVPRRLG